MRIGLLTHTTAGRGGIERVVELQVKGLRERGHHIEVVSGPAVGRGWSARAVAAVGLAGKNAASLRRYDVLLAHYQPAPWLATRSGTPFVHYFHHPLRAVHPTAVQCTRLRFRVWSSLCAPLAALDQRTVAAAAVVACPSPSVARDLAEMYGLDPVLLPLGVDTATFSPRGRHGDHLLFVGRVDEPYKHVDWAFDVARRVRRPLHIVGEGRAPAPPPRLDVVWRGYLEGAELVEAYRAAAVLLFPSVHEDFGLVPVEAMACGLPVVGWDDEHGPSLTLAPGSGGLLVQPYDLDAFTEAVRVVLDDDVTRGRLAALGPKWAEERFSLRRHLDELERLLQRVGSSPGSQARHRTELRRRGRRRTDTAAATSTRASITTPSRPRVYGRMSRVAKCLATGDGA